jgi:hypothetical protein
VDPAIRKGISTGKIACEKLCDGEGIP